MRVSSDGLVRISIAELLCTPIAHLISGVDLDEAADPCACGKETWICGYTEWVSSSAPAISIGWDWCIAPSTSPPRWKRIGAPRSNVMLLSASGDDAGWSKNLDLLSTVVDALPWREQIPLALAVRYG